MVLLGLSLVASIARAESVTELLAAAATNARFEPPARADLRIECEAGCERASLRAALLGRGETVYVEVKDGVRALVRPGQVLIAEGGKAVVASDGRPLADTDILLEDLGVLAGSSLRFPQISDDGPTGVVVMGAPAARSTYALLVYTLDRSRGTIVKTQYYKDDVSTLAKIRRDGAFVQVGGHWRPTEMTLDTLRSGMTTRVSLTWKEAPDLSPALFEPAALERPSTLTW
jgi:hypothetical protein